VDVVADEGPTSAEALQFASLSGATVASPSKLFELARGLQVHEKSVLQEDRRLSSGEAQLVFKSEHVDADGKPLKLPSLFIVRLPIFEKSPDVYQLTARLFYRKAPAGIVFWFKLWRLDLAFGQAFAEACAKVASETALPLYVGEPEQ